jgi:hypothetical protein
MQLMSRNKCSCFFPNIRKLKFSLKNLNSNSGYKFVLNFTKKFTNSFTIRIITKLIIKKSFTINELVANPSATENILTMKLIFQHSSNHIKNLSPYIKDISSKHNVDFTPQINILMKHFN